MLPAHFHDVTYDHIWSKHCRSSQRERAQQDIQLTRIKHEYYTNIIPKNLSYSHDSSTAELRDYADLIKFLNVSKT